MVEEEEEGMLMFVEELVGGRRGGDAELSRAAFVWGWEAPVDSMTSGRAVGVVVCPKSGGEEVLTSAALMGRGGDDVWGSALDVRGPASADVVLMVGVVVVLVLARGSSPEVDGRGLDCDDELLVVVECEGAFVEAGRDWVLGCLCFASEEECTFLLSVLSLSGFGVEGVVFLLVGVLFDEEEEEEEAADGTALAEVDVATGVTAFSRCGMMSEDVKGPFLFERAVEGLAPLEVLELALSSTLVLDESLDEDGTAFFLEEEEEEEEDQSKRFKSLGGLYPKFSL
mmetsp:Transcript_27880/g.45265  ORF Transcript_27880/g.45265 Transcript_27880/m.45265 type:complete len:284 (-) Transcript_27880:408-1259(-)